ncbi:MAG: two-component system chemotaxis family response regulator CheB [Rhodocyclaceae bacterium]|nr:MAG: two-component system chemotaxis family response regulator CheB [Rhodocyclaceae bacterium]TND02816.1 MAG: two-component system, chemotaxis family, response regulator CheB [Rhodocyclaceae bacterium]
MPIKVLVIDDSALMRALLTEIVNGAPDLEVVGAAPDPIAAREMIKALNPDVLTLDVEMPRMDGLEFLDRLMRLRPMPVIMISVVTQAGSDAALRALELGAVDFVAKPRAENISMLQDYAEEIREKIRSASTARLISAARIAVPPAPTLAQPKGVFSSRLLAEKVIAIGASTGGTEAIKEVLRSLPAEMPPIVMVQHMPEAYTASFARRLDNLSRLTVVEARGGERLQAGMAYLAPGHSHMRVRKNGGAYVLQLSQEEPVNRHRPAVDVLFQSVADQVGQHGLGVILTGMGKDGAQGLLAMRQAGAWTIGQDQASCVVYGMPREAAEIGALDEIASLGEISGRILAKLRAFDKR